jgi:cell division protease FtsH
VPDEVRRITADCYVEARRLLRETRDTLDAIVRALLIHETLGEAEVYAAAGLPRPPAGQPPMPELVPPVHVGRSASGPSG